MGTLTVRNNQNISWGNTKILAFSQKDLLSQSLLHGNLTVDGYIKQEYRCEIIGHNQSAILHRGQEWVGKELDGAN